MKKICHILFGGYKLVSQNDLNALYGASHAAHTRLTNLNICNNPAIEKEEILSLLNKTKQIISRITR